VTRHQPWLREPLMPAMPTGVAPTHLDPANAPSLTDWYSVHTVCCAMFLPDHEIAARLVLDVLRANQTWPVLQYLDLELARRGVRDPMDCIASVPAHSLRVIGPRGPDSCVEITVAGIAAVERSAVELHRFVLFLRRCVDIGLDQQLESPSRAKRVFASSAELAWRSPRLTSADLKIMGLLLRTEAIGSVRASDDSDTIWKIGLSVDQVWPYRYVGDIDSYLALGDGESSAA
jgi:hypothetical protein